MAVGPPLVDIKTCECQIVAIRGDIGDKIIRNIETVCIENDVMRRSWY